jgi:hypothetical protein
MKVYVIATGYDPEVKATTYQYRSLVTGASGAEWYQQAGAEDEGKQHQVIMERLYPQLREDAPLRTGDINNDIIIILERNIEKLRKIIDRIDAHKEVDPTIAIKMTNEIVSDLVLVKQKYIDGENK